MIDFVLGSEFEFVVAEFDESGQETVASITTLEHLLKIAEEAFGVFVTFPYRVHLVSGAVMYLDGKNLEYATPPCATPHELIMHEYDSRTFIHFISKEFWRQTGKPVRFYVPGGGPPELDRWMTGYHENYGLRHQDYFRLFHRNFFPRSIWDRIIVPYLVTRILFSGTGGIKPQGFVLSRRASQTTHVYHASSFPQRPIVHLKRPTESQEFLRVQITCADPNELLPASEMRIFVTAAVLLAAAQGLFDDMDYTLADPVASIKSLSDAAVTHKGTLGSLQLRMLNDNSIAAVDILDSIVRRTLGAVRSNSLSIDESVLQAWLEK